MDEKLNKEQEERAVKYLMGEAEKPESDFPAWALLVIFMTLYGSPIFGYNPAPMSEKEQIAFLKGKVEAYEKELG